MSLTVRRVVTGHNEAGHAIVTFDETTTNVVSGRPGAQMSVIWTTEGFPVINEGNDDASRRGHLQFDDGLEKHLGVGFAPRDFLVAYGRVYQRPCFE